MRFNTEKRPSLLLSPNEKAALSALLEEVNEAVPRMQAALSQIGDDIERLRVENHAFFREKGIL
jgi:hypothetical protein